MAFAFSREVTAMWRPIRKHYKVAIVWGVVCLLTFDTATACRFLARRRACRSECVVTVCEPSCCETIVSDCSGTVIQGGKHSDTIVEGKDDLVPQPAEPMSPADNVPMNRIDEKPMDDMPARDEEKPAPMVDQLKPVQPE